MSETSSNDASPPCYSPKAQRFPAMVTAGETNDSNVNAVIEAYKERAKKGFEKYGTTTERTDIDLLGWLQHLQEELMDATVYIERLKQDLQDKF